MRYCDAGVNIDEGNRLVSMLKGMVKETYTEGVLEGVGGFGALFEIKNYKNPVLVSGCDGVGTKLKIAIDMKKLDTIGIDCVAMCVNDVLCNGAKPLFFLDYFACGKLSAEDAFNVINGIKDGCILAGCSLIGGETAEMPGFYEDGEFDIAGFCVGIVEKDKIVDGSKIKEGDLLVGIESSGCHSNGYSLIRKIVTDLDEPFKDKRIGDVLLTPTNIYVRDVFPLLDRFEIKGMAHITGGGFLENIPRMFKGDFDAVVYKDSYEIPEIFKLFKQRGVEETEMYRTFNMGIGFVICVDKNEAEEVVRTIEEGGKRAYIIGEVVKGGGRVCLI
ncbi:MAG: purM [Caloramator sp.]|jgi:phosphoribosylformylglycinamidine cyclo-ligase|uniref:phosphoribosylformylglycinamidine cyclo-ligase n=1 Tax=Caloramator sp. TaxID=1871330 RepID=UPI001DD49B17|nr:phosphoribosylformylglycinamidine cyclo-ligase [Caloramator sp.]MBZ4664231.1 purM [Caloramator sp.]